MEALGALDEAADALVAKERELAALQQEYNKLQIEHTRVMTAARLANSLIMAGIAFPKGTDILDMSHTPPRARGGSSSTPKTPTF